METETIYKQKEMKSSHYSLSKSIYNLYGLLSSNALSYHMSTALSVLFEIVLYLVFAATLYFAFILPADIRVFFPAGKDLNFIIGLDFERYGEMILVFKTLLLILVLPILGFAITLRRCRKKDKLIYKAFGEVIQLKNNFEEINTNQ